MKITSLKDAFEYPTTGHFGMKALRLHNNETSGCNAFSLGMSHILPGGGTDYIETTVELIYFVLEGEVTVRTQTDAFVLKKNDSAYFARGDGKEIRNETNLPASMLVVAGILNKG